MHAFQAYAAVMGVRIKSKWDRMFSRGFFFGAKRMSVMPGGCRVQMQVEIASLGYRWVGY